MKNTLDVFRIHNLDNSIVYWLCRCAELDGTTAEEEARFILKREWERHNLSSTRTLRRSDEEQSTHQR